MDHGGFVGMICIILIVDFVVPFFLKKRNAMHIYLCSHMYRIWLVVVHDMIANMKRKIRVPEPPLLLWFPF